MQLLIAEPLASARSTFFIPSKSQSINLSRRVHCYTPDRHALGLDHFYPTSRHSRSPSVVTAAVMSALKAGDAFPQGVTFSYIAPSPETAEITACGMPVKYDASKGMRAHTHGVDAPSRLMPAAC